MRKTAASRNTMQDAVKADYNSGYIRVYSGTRPTNADTALSGNTLLAELRFGATAFGSSSAGVLTANAITSDSSADATGTASFVRLFKSDGTTALDDLSVSATGGGGEAQFSTLSFVATVGVSLSSLTLTLPVGT
jgi:hypothetical protein